MNIDLLSVNGKIVSEKVFKIGQEMGTFKCDPMARDSFYECKTFDDENGVEYLVLAQYDPNILAGRVKGVVVGSFQENKFNYLVALMEDATLCVINNRFNKKFYMQVSDKVKDMHITKGKRGIKILCKPLYSKEIKELKLYEPFEPSSLAGLG